MTLTVNVPEQPAVFTKPPAGTVFRDRSPIHGLQRDSQSCWIAFYPTERSLETVPAGGSIHSQ